MLLASLALVVALVTGSWPMQPPKRSLVGALESISVSSDVAWLEGLAASGDAAMALWRAQSRPLGQHKDLRIAAYARLGELGTNESLAAQARIDAAFHSRSLLSSSVSLNEKWVHPGWHMGDYTPSPLAELRVAGRDFVVLAADLLGPRQLFLLRCEPGRRANCTRPVPLGPWSMRYISVEATMTRARPWPIAIVDYAEAGHPSRHHGRHGPAHRPAADDPSAGDTRLARWPTSTRIQTVTAGPTSRSECSASIPREPTRMATA